jgi:WD40 repeat protein
MVVDNTIILEATMKRIIGVGILLGMVLVGCEKSVDAVSVPDQTNGRITVINDEVKLAARLTLKSENIPVDTTLRKTSANAAFGLTYIAEIAPPTVAGQKLQATSVVLNANFAFVSYNMAGSSAIGAVDVIQVKGVKNPVIRSEVTFTDTDVNSVFFDNNNVYLAEASGNLAYASPAFVERISCTGGKLDIAKNFKRMLNSYAATSVYASSGKVYVTTGSTGGLHVLTQSDTLPVVATYPLTDARWVDMDNTYVVVAQGTPGKLSVYNRSTMALLNTFSVPGATIAESKSTVRVIGGKALFAAGDGGVQLVNLATGKVVGSIARVTVSGLSPSVTVTNAVDASGMFLFSSNGEAGIYVALATQSISDLSGDATVGLFTLGKLQFANLQSVNHVAFDGSTLAIAAGLGGTKLVDFSQ